MRTNKKGISAIIHSASAAAAAAGAGLAQIPTSDNVIITPIQTTMIVSIANVYGQSLSRKAALSILAAATAGVAGRTISQVLIGWIPGYGNAINATTAFSITEAIGWSANDMLKK